MSRLRSLFCVLLLAPALLSAFSASGARATFRLAPRQALQLSSAAEERLFFELQDLQPRSTYEVRISYSAQFPAEFHLVLHADSSSKPQRRLLDTEKIVLVTDENSNVIGSDGDISNPVLVEVFWLYTGVSDIPSLSAAETAFDITLEPLLLYVIPEGALSLIVFIVLMLALALFVGVPRLSQMILSSEKGE